MDRFTESTFEHRALYDRINLGEDGLPDLPAPELPRCQGCTRLCAGRTYNQDFQAWVCPVCDEGMKEAVNAEELDAACPARLTISMESRTNSELKERLRIHAAECATCQPACCESEAA
jgi:hypothetical protein